MPTSQPGILTISIEELKVGVGADHEANESGWPVAFGKANSPYYYLALEAMTGTPEIWFVAPYQSWTAEGEGMKFNDANPALSSELGRLAKADGPFLNGYRNIQAVARPDLSYGHEQGFENAAKVYMGLAKSNAPGMSYRIYQVTGGMPGGTYLIFGTANSYSEFDKQMAESNGMWAKASPQDMATLQKTMSDDIMSTITQRYRVSPTMSYVSAEAKAKDPKFWNRPKT
jgi:hypothetical protein